MPESDVLHPLYWSELEDGTHDRYDRVRAQPSDNDLQIMWIVYTVMLFVFSLGIITVFLGIITSRKVRANPFNKYILFLSFPDLTYSFLCLITCLLSALNDGYVSWSMCQFQVFYLYSGASANSWINGVVAYEIYRLLRCSHIRQRYFPPTNRQVYTRCMVCYGIAILTGSLPLIANAAHIQDYFPTPGIQSGFVCQPTELTTTSTILFWLVLAPLVFGIPYVFATYVFVDVVWYRKLLPPKGRRRDLSIYFFRIGAMFAFLWGPTFLVMFGLRGIASPWWVWAFGAFSHTQGLVSALLTLYKRDVWDAVQHFVRHPCTACLDPDRQNVPPKATSVLEKGSSKFWTSSLNGFRTSSRLFRKKQREADAMGLPIQGPDFQFLDERADTEVTGRSTGGSSEIHHAVEELRASVPVFHKGVLGSSRMLTLACLNEGSPHKEVDAMDYGAGNEEKAKDAIHDITSADVEAAKPP